MPQVKVNGCEIYYQVHGNGEPVVLLHGLGSCGEDWRHQIEALSKTYQVIAIDVRGHGLSGKPKGPYSVALFAGDIQAVLDELKIKKASVVGFSMGGMIAFQLAVKAPELFKKLVIINSGPELVPRTLGQKIQYKSRLWILRLFGLKKLAELIAAKNFPEPAQAPLKKAMTERLANNDAEAYKYATRALYGWSVKKDLGKVKCPVLVVASDMDYTPVSFKQAYANQLASAQVAVIENSRHTAPLDQPEQLNRLLLDFLG